MLASGEPAPECLGGGKVLRRREESRAEQAGRKEQKIAEDADGVFAPRVVVAMEVKPFAAVECERGVGGEEQVDHDAGDSAEAARSWR